MNDDAGMKRANYPDSSTPYQRPLSLPYGFGDVPRHLVENAMADRPGDSFWVRQVRAAIRAAQGVTA